MSELVTRPAEPKDHNFIVDGWLEGWFVAHAAGPIPKRIFKEVYKVVINLLMRRHLAVVRVACFDDDPDQLFGFVVVEAQRIPVVHYVYTKGPFRRRGIASELMRSAGVDPHGHYFYTFKTAAGTRIAAERWRGARFDPLIVRHMPSTTEEETPG